MIIPLTPEQVPGLLKRHAKEMPEAIARGAFRAANRARTRLVRVSPVDQGQYKNSWTIKEVKSFFRRYVVVVNDAPHAGIIELGARPHKVNREGIEALKEWAKRHMLLGAQRAVRRVRKANRASVQADVDAEATRVAFAIAKKIEKYGQRGRFVVERQMPHITRWLAQEMAKELDRTLRGLR
jgi:hypothetical protein